MKTYDYFYYVNKRSLADNNSTTVPKRKILNFVQSDQEIFSLSQYEWFRDGTFHAIVCTKFLSALNIHLQGDPNLSRDAMIKFYPNLSMQALSKSNYNAMFEFESISDLVTNINYLLQKSPVTLK